MYAAFLIIAAYFCGSLPTGVWAGRRAGVDVRRSGSGNIGATNVARTAGVGPALLTLAGDIGKGLVPVLIARATVSDPWITTAAGLAAFFGHIFSVFLNFSGGKGVATAFGVMIGLAPGAAAACVVVFAVTALATRYASVASLVAALSLPIATIASKSPLAVSVGALLIAVTIVLRHRDNLARLWHGTEAQFHLHRSKRDA